MLEALVLFILVVGVVLAVVTVLGHGLWLMFAAIYRALTGNPSEMDSWPRCPACQSRLLDPARCQRCHWDATRGHSQAQSVSMVRKEIDRLLRDEQISSAVHAQLLQALAATRRPGSVAAQPSTAQPDPSGAPATTDPPPVASSPKSARDASEGFVVAELVTDHSAAGAPPKPSVPAQPADPSRLSQEPPQVAPPAAGPPVAPAAKAGGPSGPDSVPQRAAAYRQRRAKAAAEAAEQVSPPASPRPSLPAEPRQPWLAAFMEEKHIRWGELVGGLMIVASSIALVVSFWSAIAERPMLKFGVLNGVTAALFGIGMYAAKRWKLPTTSQGILLTATLLVPLNFLAIAAFSEGSEQLSLPVLVGESFSTILLGSLVFMAAKIITPSWPISVSAGIILPALGQLILRRHIDAASPTPQVYAFALAGLSVYLGSQVPVLWRFRSKQHKPLDERQGNEVFKQLGLVTFSLAVAIGLLLVKAEQPVERLQWLAPLSILLAAPAMACGLLLWKRPGSAEHSMAVAGTTLAVASVGLATAGLLLAWPQPGLLVACCTLACLVLLLMAWWYEVDEAHAAVAALASLGGALILLLLRNTLPWSVESAKELLTGLLSASGGRALTGIAVVQLVAAWQWAERARRTPAACYALVGAVTAGLGLVLVTWFGWGRAGDPESLTWLLGFYGTVAIVAGFRYRLAWGQIAGGLLFLAALGQGVVFGPWSGDLPRLTLWLVALLLHASLMSVLAAVARVADRDEVIEPSVAWSLVSSLAASVLLVARPAIWSMAVPAGHLAWIALIWLILAWVIRSTLLFSCFQAALALSLMVAVDHRLGSEAWYTSESRGWLYPTSLQWQGILLASFALAWSGLRLTRLPRFLPKWTTADDSGRSWVEAVLDPAAVSIDRGAVVLATVLLVLLAVYAVIPGIGQELSPVEQIGRVVPPVEAFQWFQMPHQEARGPLTWVLCGVVVVAFLFHLWEQAGEDRLAGITVAASTIPLLVAAQWEPEVAVASALRWSSALFFLLGSVAVWWRRPLSQWLQRVGVVPEQPSKMAATGFALLLFLAVAPILAMAIFVSLTSLSLKPATSDQLNLIWWLTILAATVVLLVLGGRRWLPGVSRDGTAVAGGLLILAVMPLFAMTAFVIGQALSTHPVVGPEPGSFFVRIGLAMSYAVPLVLLSVGLIGHAISFRSERLAFAAGLMVSFTGTAAYLLNLRVSGLLTMEQWVRLGQLNAIVASLYGLGWLGVVWLRRTRHGIAAHTADGWRRTQFAIASGFFLLPTVAMAVVVFADPRTRAAVDVAAGLWGWTALVLVVIFLGVSHWLQGRRVPPTTVLMVVYPLLILGALQLRTWPVAAATTNWWTYHLLQIAAVLAGIAALAIEFPVPPSMQPTVARPRWLAAPRPGDGLFAVVSSLPAIALLLLSLRSAPFDRQAHWWSVGGLMGVAALCVFRGWLRDRQRYYWLAALLWNLAASIWFVTHGYKWMGTARESVVNFFYWNVFALAVLVPLWTVLRQRDSKVFRPHWLALHTTATLGALLLLGWSVGLGLFEDATGGDLGASLGVTVLALAATGLACMSCLWDRRSRWAVAFCYLAGLIATGAMLDRLNLDADSMIWVSTLLLSAYGVATSYLWSRRTGLQEMLQQFGVPAESESRLASQSWLIPFNGCLALVVCALGIWVQFTCDNAGLRLAGSQAVAAQALAMGLLARGRRETELRFAALLIGVVAAVCFGWSWLSPEISEQWLNRWVVLATSLLGVAVLYGVGLVKLIRRENAWTEAAARLVPGLVAGGAVAGLVVLGSEIYLFVQYGSAHMGLPGIVAVAAALLAVAIACLIAAVVPGRDPFGLSEKQRTVYVYGAEVLVALLCLHLRVTMPELFTGFVQRYWSIVVMALAFVGVGFSEWFRRRRQMVLAEPLEKTGILLPLLPVLGFFVTPSQDVHFSLVLLTVGALYAALSVMRRSFGFGLLAVLATNGGFWYFLHDKAQISFFSHPQLWLIPLAVCVLVAAYLNRAQLTASQMTTIRYLASTVIYASSTADIFVHGVAEAPWLPMILAGFSILGIFAGILFRVRAFLFLGLSFLMVALLSVIWHAAVDLHQTWLWYVLLIIMGVMIIAVFAVFERKRQEVLRLMHELKTWDA